MINSDHKFMILYEHTFAKTLKKPLTYGGNTSTINCEIEKWKLKLSCAGQTEQFLH